MEGGAYVNSIDAVRDFRAALAIFVHEAKEALSSHDLELRRALEWLLEAQPAFWQKEIRRCEDAETQAKIELERRLNSKMPGGETPSCAEERKLLERARIRRRRAEETAAAIRRYGHAAERETEEYATRARQLADVLESNMPKAIGTLDRVLRSLEAYVSLGSGGGPSTLSTPRFEQDAALGDSQAVDEVGKAPTSEVSADVPASPRPDEEPK